MAIVDVIEIPDCSGEATYKGPSNYGRKYVVTTDTETDGEQEILAADADFVPGSAHPRYGNAVLTSAKATRARDDLRRWDVDLTYSTRVAEAAPEEENPLDDTPTVQWSFEKARVVMYKDSDDNAVTNSAGVQFDPLPEKDVSYLVLRYGKNVATFDHEQASEFADAINSGTFLDHAVGTAKVESITGTFGVRNGVSYWNVQIEILFCDDGWDLEIADTGYQYLVGGQLNDIKNTDGVKVQEPWKLDGSGLPLSDQTDPAVFLTFPRYVSRDFAELGISL